MLCTRPALLSCRRICTRNREGTPWASAMSRIRTGSPTACRAASSRTAMQAYSVFAETIIAWRPSLTVEPAFRFGEAAPAAGPLVLADHHRPRARTAADAGEALVVQRVVGNVVLCDQPPHFLLGPVGQRADLHQAEFLVPADDRRLGPVGALIAADRAGPGVHTDRRRLEHLHFAVQA